MLFEGLLNGGDGNLLTVSVPVHDAVKAHGDVGQDVTSKRNIRVKGARGANPEDIEAAVNGIYLTGLKIHVCKGVQLSHDNVYVVRADAVGESRDALSVIFSGNGHELTGCIPALDVREVL